MEFLLLLVIAVVFPAAASVITFFLTRQSVAREADSREHRLAEHLIESLEELAEERQTIISLLNIRLGETISEIKQRDFQTAKLLRMLGIDVPEGMAVAKVSFTEPSSRPSDFSSGEDESKSEEDEEDEETTGNDRRKKYIN